MSTEAGDVQRLSTTVPDSAVKGLANGWIAGYSYIKLLNSLDEMDATHGSGNRKFSIDAVVEICEQTFGYEFALLLAAVKSSFEAVAVVEEDVEDFNSFADVLQKRLKYGLPSQDSVSYFEAGFSERVVAQKVANAVFWEVANSSAEARKLVNENLEAVRDVVDELPSYFATILQDISTH
jgi:hypothetical protein